MSWLAFKTIVKKSWIVLKNYWYVPAILVYTLLMWIFFRKDNTKLLEMFDIADKNYKKEIEILNKTHEEEVKKKNELIAEHLALIAEIEEQHSVKLEDLEGSKRKELDKIIRENKENPEVLAEEMSKLFGVDNV